MSNYQQQQQYQAQQQQQQFLQQQQQQSPLKDATGLAESDDEEEHRQDLYDIVKSQRENPDNLPISRILYAAYLNEGIVQSQKIDVQQRVQDMVKNLQDQGKDGEHAVLYNLTGFFLQRGLFCIHLLEGDSFVINQYMTNLLKDFKQDKTVWTMIKIICMNEENPERMFTKHYVDELPVSGPSLTTDLDLPDQLYQDRTWNIYWQMCQAGKKHTQKSHKEKSQKKLSSEINLSNDDMSMMFMPYFMTIEQYAEMYLEDLEIRLDAELEYPYKPVLTRVLEYTDYGKLEDTKQ